MSADRQPDNDTCRYCLQAGDEEEGGSLILPCACRTPVHQRCLRQWLYHNNRGDAQRCELCREEWRGALSVNIQDVVQRLGAAQQGVPQEAVEDTVRALAGVYNGALISLMLECERERVAAEEAAGALREARDQAAAALNHTRTMAARVNPLVGTKQRLEEEAQALRSAVSRLRRRNRLQRWLLLPLILAGGFGLGLLAGGRARSGASSSGRERSIASTERRQHHRQGSRLPQLKL